MVKIDFAVATPEPSVKMQKPYEEIINNMDEPFREGVLVKPYERLNQEQIQFLDL